jgi:hypothetical protein
MAAREHPRHDLHHRCGEFELAPDALTGELLAERLGEHALVHQAQLEQVGAETPAVEHLPADRFLEIRGRDRLGAHEHLADLHRHGHPPTTGRVYSSDSKSWPVA